MSIHIILGKPGSGKSMYATQRVFQELIEGRRNIVTNLPLKPGMLNEYIQKTYPNVNVNFVHRLRILTDEEMSRFWEFRGPPTQEQSNGNDEGRGVAYFLDEAHIAFNARDWATLGRGAIHYMSQHRKLGDIIWPITQAVGNLDKQFRSVAEDYTVLRNEYTAKMGVFRGMGRFVRKSYYTEPQGKAEPFETATFHIDTKGIAACYDTAKGIGVHGSKADIGRRAKGIPIWWVFPLLIGAASLCVFIPMWMGKGASKFLTGGQKAMAQVAKPFVPPQPVVDTQALPPQPIFPSSYDVVTREPVRQYFKDLPKRKVTGVLVREGSIVVLMDDGSKIYEDDPEFQGAKRGRVKIDGVWYTPTGVPRGTIDDKLNSLQVINNKEVDKPKEAATVTEVKSYHVVTSTQQPIIKPNENQQVPTLAENRAVPSVLPQRNVASPRRTVRVLVPRQEPVGTTVAIRNSTRGEIPGNRVGIGNSQNRFP